MFGKSYPNRPLGKWWLIFLVFDAPIDVKEIIINGNGRDLPMHEIKAFTLRSAVIWFYGDILNTVVSINVRN